MADETPLPAITINIKGPSELKLAIQISPSSTVGELKDAIMEKTEVEKERQRLIYSGKVLKDDDPLTTYKIQNNHSIHLVKSAAKPTGPSASTPSASSSEARGVPSTLNAGLPYANNPLAQLEGVAGHGMGGGSFNPFLGMPGGDRNLADPNAMQDMMNNPEMVSQMMGMLTPEMIDQIIATNPQLAAMGPQVREMMSSPMMRQMLSDPAMVRQMMAMQGGMGGGAAPPNPFAAGFGAPAQGQLGAPPAGGAAANPLAGMFGAGAGGLDPAMMQRMLGGGAAGGANPFAGLGAFGAGAGAAGGAPAVPALPADTRSIEERFQGQLLQLNEMGLCDPQQNIRALTMTGGNVEAAIELIFSGRVPGGQ